MIKKNKYWYVLPSLALGIIAGGFAYWNEMSHSKYTIEAGLVVGALVTSIGLIGGSIISIKNENE